MTPSWRLPWQRLPDLRLPRLAFVLAGLLALAVFLIGETAYRNTRSMLEGLNAQGTARSNIQLLRRRLTDAETGQRGYLLTAAFDKRCAEQARAAQRELQVQTHLEKVRLQPSAQLTVYREEAEGGEVAIVSAPGAGTLIEVTLPEPA